LILCGTTPILPSQRGQDQYEYASAGSVVTAELSGYRQQQAQPVVIPGNRKGDAIVL